MHPPVEQIRFHVVIVALAVALVAGGCATASEPPVRLPGRAVAVAVAPDNPGTLWACTPQAAYRSLDGGDSWRRVPGSPGGGSVAFLAKLALVVAPSGARVGADSGGAPLVARRPPPARLVAVTSAFYPTNRLYGLDSHGGLWLSVSAGNTWSQLRAAGLPSGGLAIAARRADTTKPDTVYVAAGSRGLWVSRNFGSSFRRVAGVPDATGVATTTHDATRVLVSTPAGLLLSTDDGGRFRSVLRLAGVTAIALDSRNWRNAYAATSDGRLLRSMNGGASWDQ